MRGDALKNHATEQALKTVCPAGFDPATAGLWFDWGVRLLSPVCLTSALKKGTYIRIVRCSDNNGDILNQFNSPS